MALHSMVWHGMAWHDMTWQGTSSSPQYGALSGHQASGHQYRAGAAASNHGHLVRHSFTTIEALERL